MIFTGVALQPVTADCSTNLGSLTGGSIAASSKYPEVSRNTMSGFTFAIRSIARSRRCRYRVGASVSLRTSQQESTIYTVNHIACCGSRTDCA